MNLQAQYDKILKRGLSRKPEKGLHKHRIVPGYDGGKYEEGNVAYLTRSEHMQVHRLRYEIFGDLRDLRGAALMGERISEEERRLILKDAGHRTAKLLMERGVGVTARSKEKMSEDGRKARSHVPHWALQKGGSAAFKKLSYEDRVKGIVGTVWITDGVNNIRLKSGETIPDGFRRGRAKFERRR